MKKMEPTWQSECGRVQLYLGDCRELLPSIQCDAFVTDPPYGIGEAAGANKSRGKMAKAKDYGSDEWDDRTASEEVAMIASRDVPSVVFGGNYYRLPEASCWLIWDKMNGANDFADAEMAWTNLKKAVRLFPYRWNGMIRWGSDVREHPTQKPVEVMKWCVGHLPDDCETICDPFMGSGTTGVACVQLNRRFIGIEKESKYFEIAKRRIMEAMGKEVTVNGVRQRRMFA